MDYIEIDANGRRAAKQAPRRSSWDTQGAPRKWNPYRYYRHGEVCITCRYIIRPREDGLLGFLEYGLTVGDMLIAAAVVFLMYHIVWLGWLAFAPLV